MAHFEVREMLATVWVCGVPLKVKWAPDSDGKPELFIWGECSAEMARAILAALPETRSDKEKEGGKP